MVQRRKLVFLWVIRGLEKINTTNGFRIFGERFVRPIVAVLDLVHRGDTGVCST